MARFSMPRGRGGEKGCQIGRKTTQGDLKIPIIIMFMSKGVFKDHQKGKIVRQAV